MFFDNVACVIGGQNSDRFPGAFHRIRNMVRKMLKDILHNLVTV